VNVAASASPQTKNGMRNSTASARKVQSSRIGIVAFAHSRRPGRVMHDLVAAPGRREQRRNSGLFCYRNRHAEADATAN
jgi:hypothetical protein